MWLQRDLSIYGRVLLSKAEGVSRLVYPALSLYVKDSHCKDINTLFLNFVWKNRHHHLKSEILQLKKAEGGVDHVLHFSHLNTTFKIKWIKQYLENPESMWNFIPHNIFKKIGSLKFLMCCNYTVSKLPIKLSMFHQQALLSWKLSFVHNFSPHKEILWNNANITIRNKSIYKDEWIERNICFVADLFNDNGNIYSYEDFMRLKHFPIKYKEFKSVVNAIPAGMVQLFKSNLAYRTTIDVQLPTLTVGGKDITHKTCTNKHIRSIVQGQSKFSPRGKFYWDSQFNNISWCKAWLSPFQFCISN